MELCYSLKISDESKVAKGIRRDMNISFKHAVEIADSIGGIMLSDAIKLLGDVILMKKSIPFTRYNRGLGHRPGSGKKTKTGLYPRKASKEILSLLESVQSNAEYKGLDAEKLRIIHIQAQKGFDRKKRKPKGRWKPWTTQLVHVQVIAKEVGS